MKLPSPRRLGAPLLFALSAAVPGASCPRQEVCAPLVRGVGTLPEPAGALLLLLGVAGLAGMLRLRRLP